MTRTLLSFILGIIVVAAFGQSIDKNILEKPWKALWITGPGEEFNIWSAAAGIPESLKKHEVLKFRKSFDLLSKPASFVVHVSADNRYKLFVTVRWCHSVPREETCFTGTSRRSILQRAW